MRITQLEGERLDDAIYRSAAIIESIGSPHLTLTPSAERISSVVDDSRTNSIPTSPSPSPPRDRRRSNTISNFIRAASSPIKILKPNTKSSKNTTMEGMDQASQSNNIDVYVIPSPSSSPMLQRTPSLSSQSAPSPSSSPKISPFMLDPSKPTILHAESLRSAPHQFNEPLKSTPPLPPPKVPPSPPESPKILPVKNEYLKGGPLRLDYPKPPSFRVDPSTLAKTPPAVYTPYTLYESKPSRQDANRAELSHSEPIRRDSHSRGTDRPEATRTDGHRIDPNHIENHRVELARVIPNRPKSMQIGSNRSVDHAGKGRHEPDATRIKSSSEPIRAQDIMDHTSIPALAPSSSPVLSLAQSPALSPAPGTPTSTHEPVRISTVRPVARDLPTPMELMKKLSHSNLPEVQPVRITPGISLSSDNLVCG